MRIELSTPLIDEGEKKGNFNEQLKTRTFSRRH